MWDSIFIHGHSKVSKSYPLLSTMKTGRSQASQIVYPIVHYHYSSFNPCPWCRSQWPRGLKAWVCGRSFVGIAASNPAGGLDVCILWVLCVVTYRSLRRTDNSPKGILLSMVCDREASTMRRPWPTTRCRPRKIKRQRKQYRRVQILLGQHERRNLCFQP